MGTYSVQFNESTGKVIYNSVTDKVQMKFGIAPCNFCVSPPEQVQVTFSGVSISSGCYDCGGSALDRDYSNIPNINTTYTLTGIDSPDCTWTETIALSPNAVITAYDSTDGSCTDFNSIVETYDRLVVSVRMVSTTAVIIRASLIPVGSDISPTSGEMFIYPTRPGYTPTSGCVEISDLANGWTAAFLCRPATGGTVTITEI